MAAAVAEAAKMAKQWTLVEDRKRLFGIERKKADGGGSWTSHFYPGWVATPVSYPLETVLKRPVGRSPQAAAAHYSRDAGYGDFIYSIYCWPRRI